MIQAAGGVLVDLSRQKPRYLVVHRADIDEWCFPNAKRNGKEPLEETALRSVRKATGFESEIVGSLGRVSLTTPRGKAKMVRYWLVTQTGGAFEQTDRIDAAVWLKKSQVVALLTHDRDRELVARAHEMVAGLRAPRDQFARNQELVRQLAAARA